MPIFALYNFDDTGLVAADSAVANGAQDGAYFDGAAPVGGRAVLDGINDKVKIYPSPTFQLPRGTLEIQFSQTSHVGDYPNTVLSRDTASETPGGYRIEVMPDGSVLISHESATATTTFQTDPGFVNPGDEINVVYSWDATSGGSVQITNLTTDDSFEDLVPAGLTMNQGPMSQPWMIGAGQSQSDAGQLNNLNNHFQGSVEMFSLSDTVDNFSGIPTANPDTAETDEDTPIDVIPVLANDTDPTGQTLTITGTPTSENGTVGVNPDGTLSYTPNPDFNGTDTITYTITDPDGNESTSTVTVTVNPVNDGPVAVDDVDSTEVDTAVVVDLIGNDTDVDNLNSELSITGTPTSADGTVVVNPDGRSVTFTPNPGFTGVATINYTVTDPDGLTDDGVATITVADDDGETPIANPDTAETDEDTPIDVIPVLANDTDPNLDPLTISGTPTAENGTVGVNPDGTLSYTPNPEFSGTDTITYTITDPDGNEATSTVTVTVNPVNDAPVAVDDEDVTAINTPVTLDIIANDTDVDNTNPELAIAGTPTSAQGTVEVGPDGRSITFTPNAGFTGVATINYTVTDPDGLTDEGVVTITVGDPDAPVANPDTAETDEDTPIDIIPVLANDTDPNLDPLTISGTPTAENGTVGVNPDGTLSYTPNPDFNGVDTITYTITDPDGNEATSTVTVTVNPVNDGPVAVDDEETGNYNESVVVDLIGNDTDVDNPNAELSIFGTPTSPDGTVVVNPDGRSVTFTPNANFIGEATINYTVTDPDGLTDDGVATVTIEDPDRDGIVRGTDDGNLIDTDYIDPFDADRVDAGDAILDDDAPNDDRIRAEGGDDTVFAGLGDDTVFAGLGDDLVYGEEGDDDLRGNEGNDTLYGGDGSDTVYGQQDDDFIDTSASTPIPDIDYPGVYPADTDPNNDRDLVYGGLGNDTILTGDDADTIFGDGGDDSINSGIDADLVYGGGGDDTIIGSEGADTIFGEDGNDLIYGGLDDVIGDALDLPDDIDLRPLNNPDLIDGGAGNDTIYGRDDNDTLIGGTGNDLLFGGVDNDLLSGDLGNDTLHGDEGDDILEGDGGNDVFYGGTGVDTMFGGADRDDFIVGLGEGAGSEVYGGSEGDDFDRLIIEGPRTGYLVVETGPDSDGNGIDGRVEYLDADGNITGTLQFENIEEIVSVPCFTPGTLIATPKGEVPIENLRAGDRIITRDNGIQELRWIGQRKFDWAHLTANPHLRPIMVRRGSLGNGLPERDMMLSPNHRVLVSNDRTSLYFDEHEVLVSAKHLVGGKGIFEVESIGTTYIHLMFDQHEVVLSDGAWTESFQPGDYTLNGMGNAQRNEILELFPELKTKEGLADYTAARRTLKKHEATLLVR
ncbi:tandem-95 repeat protein [Pseudorhodobacter sp. E13]|uniref:Ig-like domain-containing protein n=1 Tax=Pseudorhodobacter sp. E13 TaxID=2487931 RepID=UPI000F8D2312|nr:Ig-like domain-containing protein [Pseudorhodobacter sp. E13]RUS59290.1 tandem-95 repeat protein [Pseudorhodobacter sp. E13]